MTTDSRINAVKHTPDTPLPFPVVNGMVAIEHVRYLMDDRARLVAALRDMAQLVEKYPAYFKAGEANMSQYLENANALLRELGETVETGEG